jgi:hypothetical protein
MEPLVIVLTLLVIILLIYVYIATNSTRSSFSVRTYKAHRTQQDIAQPNYTYSNFKDQISGDPVEYKNIKSLLAGRGDGSVSIRAIAGVLGDSP